MAIMDHTLQVGDAVRVIAGPHRGHSARVVELGDATASRHTVRCLSHGQPDGETLRVSKVHVQRDEAG
jgi:ribosomal protein L24